jgi:Arc/MetJ-type ribon-helix-helix transcriptional regulator
MVEPIVRITICLPPDEVSLVEEARQRLGKASVLKNRSEVIRAAVRSLATMADEELAEAARSVPHLKPGRR